MNAVACVWRRVRKGRSCEKSALTRSPDKGFAPTMSVHAFSLAWSGKGRTFWSLVLQVYGNASLQQRVRKFGFDRMPIPLLNGCGAEKARAARWQPNTNGWGVANGVISVLNLYLCHSPPQGLKLFDAVASSALPHEDMRVRHTHIKLPAQRRETLADTTGETARHLPYQCDPVCCGVSGPVFRGHLCRCKPQQ